MKKTRMSHNKLITFPINFSAVITQISLYLQNTTSSCVQNGAWPLNVDIQLEKHIRHPNLACHEGSLVMRQLKFGDFTA